MYSISLYIFEFVRKLKKDSIATTLRWFSTHYQRQNFILKKVRQRPKRVKNYEKSIRFAKLTSNLISSPTFDPKDFIKNISSIYNNA